MIDGWQVKRLDEICEIARGGSPRPIQSFLTDDPNGVNWVKISDATASGKYVYSTAEKIRPEGVSRSRLVKPGDFLLSNSMSFGRPYIMQTTGCIHDGWLVLSDKSGLFDPDYLYYFLGSDAAYQQFDRLAAGSTVRNLNIELASRVKVLLPPIPEQRRIVATLDEAFEGIDKAIANAEKNIANTRELFTANLEHMCNQITATSSNQPLASLCKPNRVITYGVIKLGEHDKNGVPCLRTSNVRWLKIDEDGIKKISPALSQDYRRTILSGGELLVNVRGTLGGVALAAPHMAGWNVSREVAVVPIDPSRIRPEFVALYVGSRSSQSWLTGVVKGVAYKGINIEDLRNLPVPTPSMEQQAVAADRLNQALLQCRELEGRYRRKLQRIFELKQSVLQKAFSGQLTGTSVSSHQHHSKCRNQATSAEFGAKIIAFAYHQHAARQKAKTFGRVKAQKVLHLVESVAGIDLGRQPIKDAAGPNDSAHHRRAEDWAKANKLFEFVKRGDGYEFHKLKEYGSSIDTFLSELEPFRGRLKMVLDLLVPMNSKDAEVFATVHAAWNNLILDGIEPTDTVIIKAAREDWHPAKLKISKSKFSEALKFIRDNNLQPNGSAKRVGGQGSLL